MRYILVVLVVFFGALVLFRFGATDSYVADVARRTAVGRVLPEELLPDLVPLPAEDLRLELAGDLTYMHFSTTYFNQGAGPLELLAFVDSTTTETEERAVSQRIYRSDGSYRDGAVGTFVWHDEHAHYHFSDFVSYNLETSGGEVADHASLGIESKTTFCLRDVSRVRNQARASAPEATYRACGNVVQGVSVGWGDTYFSDYPGQLLNITDLPSGTYTLSFIVNPDGFFEETSERNNMSSVTFALSMEDKTLTVLAQEPLVTPEVEHVYPDEPFGKNSL